MSTLNEIDEQPSGVVDEESLYLERVRHAVQQSGGISPDDRQRRWLRWSVIVFSVLLIVCFGCLEYYILGSLTQTTLSSNKLFGVLGVAPIVAVTTIIVFMLIGVFRVQPSDVKAVSVENASRLLAGQD